jgi:hypothetical protein
MTKDEALKLALEALQAHGAAYLHHELRYDEAITAIKETLAQPAQEPDELTIAYMSGLYDGKVFERKIIFNLVQKIAARFYKDDAEKAFEELTEAIQARGKT